MSNSRRVVVTGLGIISPLGNTAEGLWEAMCAGRSGVAELSLLPPIADRVSFAGECRNFTGEIDNFGPLEKDAKKAIRKALKVMCRETMMAVASAQLAVGDAKCADSTLDPERCGVVFGSDYMLSPPADFVGGMTKCGASEGTFRYSDWGTAGLAEMNPLWMLKYLPNMPGSHIAIFSDFRGPNNSLTMRESSGLLAIREAMQTIERGHADLMLAGATGTRVHPFKTVHAIQTEQLADPSCPASQACRPFDAQRTGMVLGEGSGTLVLEELESARRRGAPIYAEIVGTGSSSVSKRKGSDHRRRALAQAGAAALAESGISPLELGHVNAHGLATQQADAEEAAALVDVLGDRASEVSTVAPKSYYGNLGAGSGVVELVASILALKEQDLCGTLNYVTPDPTCPLRLSADSSLPPGQSCLKLSVTPQGQAAALVLKAIA